MAIKVRLLGYPKISAGAETYALPRDKRGALLAYLAFHAERVGREHLAFLFWPDSSDSTARANLRQLLRRSKSLAYAADLDIDSEHVCWQVHTDVTTFQTYIQDQNWLEAIQTYPDHLLQDFGALDSPGFETWLELERSNLKLNWQEAAFRVTENLAKTDRAAEAASLVLQLWRLSDYDESFLQRYLKQAYVAGQKTVALAAFATFRDQLQKTFEVDVSEETQDLIEAIKRDSLKPEKLSNLPSKPQPKRSLQPLLGRQQELSELTNLLKKSECRALCLTGPGGVGKTRLAQQLAQQLLVNYEHGVYFVALASISTPEEIPGAIASALSFTFYGKTPAKTQLANYLHNKTMLLIIDNLEHLLEGASLLAELLAEAPELTLLITSRQLPELAEVWPFALQGLAYEQPESDAEKLYIQLAKKQQPRFYASEVALESIRRICKLVEGLPLAIELAASWARELSPKEILEQLGRSFELLKRDGKRQHDSMQAVFNYSWQLLSPEQHTLLAQLSVFRGGFTSAAAETVAGATPYLLLSLQNRSLLNKDEEGRYYLHELIRQFALDKLKETGIEGEAFGHHARYFAAFMARQSEQEHLGHWDKAKTSMASEIANLRVAWDWLVQQHLWPDIAKSFSSLSGFLISRGLNQEGKEKFEYLLDILSKTNHTDDLLRARTEAQLGAFCRILGDSARAQTLLEMSLAVLEKHHHVETLLFVYHTLGILQINLGNYDQAETWFQRSHDLSENVQHIPTLTNALGSLGNVCVEKGKHNEALTCYQRGLHLARELGNQQTIAHLLFNQANVLWELGDKTSAEDITQKASQLAKSIEHWPLYAASLANLAEIRFASGDYEASSKLRQQSLALARQLGDRRNETLDVIMLGYDALRLGQKEESREYFLEGLKLAYASQLVAAILDVFIGLAELDLLAHKPEIHTLARLVFASDHPSTLAEARKRARDLLQNLETQISPELLKTSREQAQLLHLEQVVQELLHT